MSKKKIIIIGGSGSIGSSIAKEIIKDEFEPHLIGRNYASLKKISDELKCPYSVADVTKSKDLIQAFDVIAAREVVGRIVIDALS